MSEAARGPTIWVALARKMGPQTLLMDLKTLLRHDVFHVASSLRGEEKSRDVRPGDAALCERMVNFVAARIADASELRASEQFPYQYFAAYLKVDSEVWQKSKTALHKSAEIASCSPS